MAKFDGLLLCTDLDDTLLTDDKRVSEENIAALQYFMENGGLFTFATGRVPEGARLMLQYIVPNAPMVCFNGGAIYDYASEKFIWQAELNDRAEGAIAYVEKNFPPAGIEVCTDSQVYFCRVNRIVEEHKRMENFPDNDRDYHDIHETWRKVMFMVEEKDIEPLKNVIAESPYANDFTYMRSSPWYYELLPKGATKGAGMLRLAKLLGIRPENTIGMGDNENDLSLVQDTGLGIAVANAADCIKKAATMLTVDNNSHAVSAVVKYLESRDWANRNI